MKKLSYLCLGILFSALLFVTGCLKKTQISGDEFIEVFKNKGYEVIDASNEIESKKTKAAYIATKNDFYISFYVLENNQEAEMLYNHNKEIIEKIDASISEEDKLNYKKYVAETKDEYIVISQIEETLLYTKLDIKNKDEVSDLLKQIGY